MHFFNTLLVALKALLRNPTRALLTTLGIVIGIAAVITMMEIGKGSSASIRRTIEKMGANTVLGLGALALLNATSQLTGLSLGFNLFNGLVVGILGVPGLGLLLLARWTLGT